jgi:hypothetical protein
VLFKKVIVVASVLLLTGCSASEVEQLRVNRLANKVNIEASVGDCVDKNALACYNLLTDETFVTELGLSYDDDTVLCALRHEARHQWQDENNLIQYVDGVIVNRDWLEWDAYTNGC